VVPDGPGFTNRERLALLSHVDKLSHCIGGTERIHQTVVPLNYARHTLRALTLWLISLPFALLKELKYLTGPVLFLVSWLLFGVYEIGYAIEDPFQGSLRLSIMCDSIRRDVLGEGNVRVTAFQLDDLEVNGAGTMTVLPATDSIEAELYQ
jgi:predicted membrane chloride channel (bestrophin family)